MDDIKLLDNNAKPKVLRKQGFNAIVNLAGGIGLLLLRGPVGAILGIAAVVLGVVALKSNDPEDKKPGMLLVASGFLAIAAKVGILSVIKASAGTLLVVGAIGLIATGVINAIKFVKGIIKLSK